MFPFLSHAEGLVESGWMSWRPSCPLTTMYTGSETLPAIGQNRLTLKKKKKSVSGRRGELDWVEE